MPSTKDLIKAKISALKAEIEPDSISPSYLGEILDDMVDEHDNLHPDKLSHITIAGMPDQITVSVGTDDHSVSGRIPGASSTVAGVMTAAMKRKLDKAAIPKYIEFDGIADRVTPLEVSTMTGSTTEGYKVIFVRSLSTFLLCYGIPDPEDEEASGFNNWADGDDFGVFSENGRVPYAKTLYLDRSSGRFYRAEAGELILAASGFKDLRIHEDALNFNVGAYDFLGKYISGVYIPKPLSIVSWAYLQNLRRSSNLIPGQMYRIIDYITTVANDSEACSAGHPFDVVVTALTNNTLAEEAYVMHSIRDTDGYFGDAKLEAWKIWYCIDNDTTRFQWADTSDGKGVIYRMIDEFHNDCPYDFKNIQFKRYKIISGSQDHLKSLFGSYLGLKDGMNLLVSDNNDYTWAYTFSLIKGERCTDASVCEITRNCQCENNHIHGYITTDILDDAVFQVLSLNNIVCIIDISDMPGDRAKPIRYNSFGPDCYSNTLFGLPRNNSFGYYCACNIVGGDNNTFGYKCSGNSFGIMCNGNTFGDECMDNIIGDRSECNTFGDGCSENILGKYSLRNTLSDRCVHNDLSSGCLDNKLANHCRNNILGGDCEGNSFNCQCRSIELGNSCIGNIFGTGCVNIRFGTSYKFNTVGNDVENLEIDNEAGSRDNVRYVTILNGTKLSDNPYSVVPCPEYAPYSFFVGVASDGTPRMGFLADIL